jgi:hypothetical protein
VPWATSPASAASTSPGFELGQHDPTLSTLEKLAKALKVKVGRLLE